MTARELDKSQWRTFFDRLSKTLEGKQAEIEVASLSLGDQVEAEWLPFILDVPGLGFVDVPEKEYARLYERLASSDPEQIEAAMVSLRAIKAAEDLEIEAAQRRPALSSDDTYLERDLSEPISFDRPSSSSRRPGRSLGLY